MNRTQLLRFECWWRKQTPHEGDPVLRWVPAASAFMWRGHAMVVWEAAIEANISGRNRKERSNPMRGKHKAR